LRPVPAWTSVLTRINLATVTYLFEGEIMHRDSLGSHQVIRPGEINWMTFGHGIVHSERTPPDRRASGQRVHGIQLWVALPRAHEETAPEFHHHPVNTLPELQDGVTRIRVLAGKAYGMESPVHTFSPLFHVDVMMPEGSGLPLLGEYEERAAYIVEGAVSCGPERAAAARMLVFSRGSGAILRAESPARCGHDELPRAFRGPGDQGAA
jgi:redox-sensitive bicupin YhaK (pirin superfamily)